MDGLFAGSVATDAGDPLIIGYFLDNVQGFEDLPRAIPALPAKHACKRALIDMLRKRYPGIREFNTAWNLDAPSFDALAERGLPLATKAAYADMFAGMAATHAAVYDVWLDGRAPYRFDHPRFSTAGSATRSVSAGPPD